MSKKIAQVVVDLPVAGPFDYLVEGELVGRITVGQRVLVPFGRRKIVGFVVGIAASSLFKTLKPITQILDQVPTFDANAIKLSEEFARYYGCSLGEAMATTLSRALRKKTLLEIGNQDTTAPERRRSTITVYVAPEGPAGWEHILEPIQACLKKQAGVILLVPEVSQIKKIERFVNKNIPAEITVLDRKLSVKEEKVRWTNVKAGLSRIVIGTRSAVFSPVRKLGLIVIMDDDNRSFKQEQSPFYHVREVAMMRAGIEQCSVIVFGPAPSAEIWHKVNQSRQDVTIVQPENAPDVQMIDLSNYKPRARTILSFPLQTQIGKVLEEKGRVLLFLNRRGGSTSTRCNHCGKAIHCRRCDVNLSFLHSKKELVCHLCGWSTELPKTCPQCHGKYLRSMGIGIETVESEVARIFPQSRIARFDRDTKTLPRSADVIIATQAVLRVLEYNQVDLTAVLDLDSELNRVDFRSEQHAFSLLTRLRDVTRKRMVVQTNQVDNYALKAVIKNDISGFYQQELTMRREAGFPPYNHMVELTLRGKKETDVLTETAKLAESLRSIDTADIEILGPQPDIRPKLRDQYRFIIMLKSPAVDKAHNLIQKALKLVKIKRTMILTVNVDP